MIGVRGSALLALLPGARRAAAACGGVRTLASDAAAPPAAAAGLDDALLRLLVCPLAKTPLRYDRQAQLLINDALGVAYPVVDGIPHLTPTAGQLVGGDGDGGAAARER